MPKRKHKNPNRYKVNFNNEKTDKIISYLQLAENRISRNELLSLGNKDIMYSLIHSGYIKQTDKSVYQGTSKLHNYILKRDNKHFSSSGSSAHSTQVRKTLGFLPESIFLKRSFNSSFDIEKSFNKKILPSQEYKERLTTLKSNYQCQLQQIESNHLRAIYASETDFDRYSSKIDYLNQKEACMSQLSLLNTKGYLTPDYEVTFSKEELQTYIDNLIEYRDSLDASSKTYSIYSESINTLQSIPVTQEITVCIEVITSSYQDRELTLHRNYQALTNCNQIFLM